MFQIIEINENNISDYPQFICFINPKNEFYNIKIEWLKHRFEEGMKIKLLQLSEGKKIAGFIEYVPGEFAWRGVNAKDYMFIHCLWVNPNKNKEKGFGSILVNEAVKDAQKQNLKGVAVITSDDSFMAKRDLFVKNKFELLEERDKFQLLAISFKKERPKISFNINKESLQKYKGWHIIYSKQCPWVARFVEEVKPILEKEKISVSFKELKTSKEAQSAPAIYSGFTLIKDGKILADRYISTTRFINIMKKV